MKNQFKIPYHKSNLEKSLESFTNRKTNYIVIKDLLFIRKKSISPLIFRMYLEDSDDWSKPYFVPIEFIHNITKHFTT